ncbi:MAG: hypothetical protein II343_03920 [Clostridia bacterium]|nr:hypothetical protein [Clostridia bacterium]
MKIEAIVYSSMTGYTAQYAQMISEKTGIPAYALDDAGKLADKTKVLYMSWLMAGTLVNYKKAAEKFDVSAVCSVGLNATEEQIVATRKSSKIPETVKFFALQGGYNPGKLKGMYKFMMKIVTKVLIKKISSLPDQGEAEEKLIEVLRNGGSFVKEENIAGVAAYLEAR